MCRLAAAAVLLAMWAAAPPVEAEDLSRADRLKVLYSNQFAFDRRGFPMITVSIVEGLKQVVIAGDAPPRLLPDGEEGTEVSGGKRWQVSIHDGKAAQVEHFAILSRVPAGNLVALRQELALWKSRGVETQLLELGAAFGVKGRVFDNRAHVLVAGPFAGKEEAVGAGEEQHRKHGLASVSTIAQLKSYASGRFVAEDLETRATVRAPGALWFAPQPGKRLTVEYADPQRGGAATSRSFWGEVYVAVDRNGAMVVVNSVPADRLLAGLVPAEIFAQGPTEALRAQAVAARGELLAKIGTRHLEDPHLLCSTQHCQVYAGAGKEHPRTTEAVSHTRGQLMVRADGGLVDTVYSASCGGHTEHNNLAWPVPADDNLRGRLDGGAADPALKPFAGGITGDNLASWLNSAPPAWCGRSTYNRDKYRWTVRIPADRLSGLLKGLGLGGITGVEVLSRGVSGRATVMRFTGVRGRKEVKGELALRRLLGNMRSSMFLLEVERDAAGRPREFIFKGGGWGHGVGMCQTGATGMAQAGKTYKEILEHYYPGGQLKTLY